jgi:hypothetical protein
MANRQEDVDLREAQVSASSQNFGLAWLGLAWLGLAWLGLPSANAHIKQRTHQTKKSQLGRIKKK